MSNTKELLAEIKSLQKELKSFTQQKKDISKALDATIAELKTTLKNKKAAL